MNAHKKQIIKSGDLATLYTEIGSTLKNSLRCQAYISLNVDVDHYTTQLRLETDYFKALSQSCLELMEVK